MSRLRLARSAKGCGGPTAARDPAFTLRVYAHAMRRSDEERARLKALVEGHDWAHIGHKTARSGSSAARRDHP
jgi:hypothetical protein